MIEQKVVLMGGYGRSRSLAAYLESVLANDPTYDGIELKRTQLMSVPHSHPENPNGRPAHSLLGPRMLHGVPYCAHCAKTTAQTEFWNVATGFFAANAIWIKMLTRSPMHSKCPGKILLMDSNTLRTPFGGIFTRQG